MTLHPRETQVLQCAARGLSCKATAAELGLSSNTVRVYRHGAFRKIGTANIVTAVLQAKDRGLI